MCARDDKTSKTANFLGRLGGFSVWRSLAAIPFSFSRLPCNRHRVLLLFTVLSIDRYKCHTCSHTLCNLQQQRSTANAVRARVIHAGSAISNETRELFVRPIQRILLARTRRFDRRWSCCLRRRRWRRRVSRPSHCSERSYFARNAIFVLRTINDDVRESKLYKYARKSKTRNLLK